MRVNYIRQIASKCFTLMKKVLSKCAYLFHKVKKRIRLAPNIPMKCPLMKGRVLLQRTADWYKSTSSLCSGTIRFSSFHFSFISSSTWSEPSERMASQLATRASRRRKPVTPHIHISAGLEMALKSRNTATTTKVNIEIRHMP